MNLQDTIETGRYLILEAEDLFSIIEEVLSHYETIKNKTSKEKGYLCFIIGMYHFDIRDKQLVKRRDNFNAAIPFLELSKELLKREDLEKEEEIYLFQSLGESYFYSYLPFKSFQAYERAIKIIEEFDDDYLNFWLNMIWVG